MNQSTSSQSRSLSLILLFFVGFYLFQQPTKFFQTRPDEEGLFQAAVSLSKGVIELEPMSSLLSILALPMVYLGKLFSVLFRDPFFLKLVVNSTNILLACGLLAIFFYISKRWFRPPIPTAMTVLLGAGTTINFYAVHFFNEILAGLLICLVFWAMIRAKRDARFLVLAGFLVSISELNRIDGFLIALPCIVFLILECPRKWYWFGGGLLAGVIPVVVCWYGLGDATPATAYQGESLSNPIWVGMYGFLFSPGRSLFVYSPVLILSLIGFPAFYRRYRSEAVFVLVAVGAYGVLYSTFWNWLTVWGWGPRYLVKLIPLLMLPVGTVLYRSARSVGWSILVVGTSTISIAIQLLSTAVNYQNTLNLLHGVMGFAELNTVTNPFLSPLFWQWHEWQVQGGFQNAWWTRGYGTVGWLILSSVVLLFLLILWKGRRTLSQLVRPVTTMVTVLFLILGVTVSQVRASEQGLRRAIIRPAPTAVGLSMVEQGLDPHIDYRQFNGGASGRTIVWRGDVYLPNSFVYQWGMIANNSAELYLDGERVLSYQSGSENGSAQFVRSNRLRFRRGWHDITVIYREADRSLFKVLYFPLQSFWQPIPSSYLKPSQDSNPLRQDNRYRNG